CQPTYPISELTKERLSLSKDAALLLKSICLMQKAPENEILPHSDDYRRASRLKQEAPVLRSDPELDLLHFGSTDIPSFSDLRIPFEIIDTENNEGFEWSTAYLAYPAQCDERAKTEKLG